MDAMWRHGVIFMMVTVLFNFLNYLGRSKMGKSFIKIGAIGPELFQIKYRKNKQKHPVYVQNQKCEIKFTCNKIK